MEITAVKYRKIEAEKTIKREARTHSHDICDLMILRTLYSFLHSIVALQLLQVVNGLPEYQDIKIDLNNHRYESEYDWVDLQKNDLDGKLWLEELQYNYANIQFEDQDLQGRDSHSASNESYEISNQFKEFSGLHTPYYL